MDAVLRRVKKKKVRRTTDNGKVSLMTEPELTQTLQVTALSVLLQSSRTSPAIVPYRGVLTPKQLDAPEKETAALVRGAAIHDLGWLRRVAVRGADRFRWLSGMVTNTVNDLFPDSGAWNLVLNAQGRIQGELTVWRGGEETSPQRRNPVGNAGKKQDKAGQVLGTPFAGESELELEIAADQMERLLAHLNAFIVMDDVELVSIDEEPVGETGSETAIGLTGPEADAVLERVGLPTVAQPMAGITMEWNGWDLRILRNYGALAPHYEIFVPSAGLEKVWSCLRTGGALPVGCVSLERFRIAEGIPAYGVDIAERDLPQETSQTRALHFNKGCYLGQEIVERIHSRGAVHRHLRHLELSGPVPAEGAELTGKDGKAAGQITSAAELKMDAARQGRVFALAMIRAEAEAGEPELRYKAGDVEGAAKILAAPPKL